MQEIKVKLITPSGSEYTNVGLPTDMTVTEMINELKQVFKLPERTPEGVKIQYSVRDEAQARVLDLNATLSSLSVEDGTTLLLSASEEVIEQEALPRFGKNEIEVFLTSKDLNRTEKERFDVNQTAEQVVSYAVSKYQLPQFDPDRNPISYQLHSNHRGAFVLPKQTLQQAGIPNNDRLFIHHNALPGGRNVS